MRVKKCFIIVLMLAGALSVRAQSVLEIIKQDPTFAVTNYALYPDSAVRLMTPPPAGKIGMVHATSTNGWGMISLTS